ncbi:hypothetical protein GURKE_00260 [Brevundimonas phage vB_BpoS-Gurke]|uniref:Uncharacterized protein n=1 Tax=Brevundimonas phage vB_BpoS-Gurke TaxID=2948599 RepID=A0A9E7N1L2_9CAUD|nr:hypothetical protein GURKE_00260 [Brevundimonas phage vB_BpoS-Gurke]
MTILIWRADHANEAVGYAMGPDGTTSHTVFDIQLSAGKLVVYDYVNSSAFKTDHLVSVEQAKIACEIRYRWWLEQMGLIALSALDEEQVAENISTGYWRTRLQINDGVKLNARRLDRALTSLIEAGRIEFKVSVIDGKSEPVYRRPMS